MRTIVPKKRTTGKINDRRITVSAEMRIKMEKDMEQVMKKAEVLIEALPYIQKFNRKIIVVKYLSLIHI